MTARRASAGFAGYAATHVTWTCALEDPAAFDRATAGGKALGLARLVASGAPVPRGFVVLASAMDAVLAEDAPAAGGPWSDAAVRAEAARRASSIASVSMPTGFEDELRMRLAALGDGPLAVRSSGVEEDSRERSAAGQYESIVGVRGFDATLAAIRACWASVHSHRAAVYRARAGKAPFGARAAVIVQRLADADVSGVVFTRDPVRPRSRHLVVEAAPGAGGVVGGGSVQRWEIPREGGGAIVGGGGAATGALLDEPALRELARLALSAEKALGGAGESRGPLADARGADVEFAWSRASGFALLQLRPVTAPRPVRSRGRGIVWTQRFSGERWIEPITPFGWSIIGPALARFTDWRWASRRYLRGTGIARLHQGLPFFNVTVFRHLLVKTPWTPTPEFVLELFPPEEAAELRRRRWILPTPGFVLLVIAEALLRGRWRHHRFLWLTNPRDWRELAPQVESAARATDLRDPDRALDEIARLRPWIDRYVGVHLWSLLWANLFYQALGVFLERFGGRDLQLLRPALVVSGAAENVTVRANLAVEEIASAIASDAALAERVRSAPDGAAALAVLRAEPSPAGAAARVALSRVLDRFGRRARATWEVFSPRWRDEPELVVEMARASRMLRRTPDRDADPEGALRGANVPRGDAADREASLLASRAAAEATLDARVKGWRRVFLRWLLENARVFSQLRENQRFVFDELLLAVRDAALVLGQSLADRRRLSHARDVTLLSLDEAAALDSGALSAAEASRRIGTRRAEMEEWRLASPPEFLFEHAGDDARRTTARGAVLVGLGISPGIARGRVRVARSLDEASRLQPGEVLVAKAADPGWTPYFPSAAGLVTELGGLLSHAAVVAREYGLPAVANVADATRDLRDGDEVVLDGDAGTVRRV